MSIYKINNIKNLIVFSLLLFSTVMINAQWVSNYGNTGGDISFADAKGKSITSDASGNSFVTGYAFVSGRNNDIVVIKYGNHGQTLWDRVYNGSADLNDEGRDIYTDNSGNIYVLGNAQFTGSSYDAVLLKYSANGDLLWVDRYNGSVHADFGNAMAVDNDNNVYITGYTTGSDGYKDIFVRKISSQGTVLWTRTIDGEYHFDSEGLDIAVSGEHNVYITGYFTASGSNADIAVVKYNGSGTLVWSKEINGTGSGEDKAWGIVVDQAENVYITGYTTSQQSNMDSYTAKFNSAGTILWSKTFNGGGNQTDKAWGIVVDAAGSVYISGETVTSSLNTDYLIIKYSASGSILWNKTYNGAGNGEDVSTALCLLPNENNLIVTGKSWGTDNTFDFATIKLNASTGNQSEQTVYSLSANTQDVPTDIKCLSNGQTVITGYSVNSTVATEPASCISTVSYDMSKNAGETVFASGFTLHQNYPNPFNPVTNIQFDITTASAVKLAVYDMMGREVSVLVNRYLTEGNYSVTFNASNLPSGIYFCKIEAGSYSAVNKMTLIK